jgi:lysophospholipase L1-like esterase
VIVSSFAAIGDSFSEGMGDELPDGSPRGWADLVALGLAAAHAAAHPEQRGGFGYANFAIRGRLLGPILAEQFAPAVALRPELLTINGGGNDIMRPRVSVASTADRLVAAAREAEAAGIRVAIVSGADPTRHLPLGPVFKARGDELAVAVRERLAGSQTGFIDNWSDAALTDLRYWSVDRLHLNSLGHARVAGNVLAGLGVEVPEAAHAPHGEGEPDIARPRTAEYWRQYVLPWIGRRLTGRSSGDGRTPKRPTLLPVELPNEL